MPSFLTQTDGEQTIDEEFERLKQSHLIGEVKYRARVAEWLSRERENLQALRKLDKKTIKIRITDLMKKVTDLAGQLSGSGSDSDDDLLDHHFAYSLAREICKTDSPKPSKADLETCSQLSMLGEGLAHMQGVRNFLCALRALKLVAGVKHSKAFRCRSV